MTNLVFGRTDAELQRKLAGYSVADLQAQGRVAGTPDQVVDQLKKLAEVGVQRVMLQWLDLDDIAGLEALAQTVLPQL
jgi:alkanesulfonate monooxygenase SsuD/methylene tetrahydromethanopterin reductase-like flavin-dependent oxidoreductase (luciferase family)